MINLGRTRIPDQWMWIILLLALVLAAALPLGPLVFNRFHHDEAVYSGWGLDIATGKDPLVSGSPVDKPPLFLYVQAFSFRLFGATEVAARIPSLLASVASVILVFLLGQSLYGRPTGLAAGFLFAVSPFVALFAATAFTDPLMVLLILAGCLSAVRAKWGWSGLFLGLAAITKQQGIFFIPLAVALGSIVNLDGQRKDSTRCDGQLDAGTVDARAPHSPSPTRQGFFDRAISRFLLALFLPVALGTAWDISRARQPGFLVQSFVSYGAPTWQAIDVWNRLLGFAEMLRYSTGSPLLNWMMLLGIPLLLVLGLTRLVFSGKRSEGQSERRQHPLLFWLNPPEGEGSGTRLASRTDVVLAVYLGCFVIGHAVLPFQVWDRYLLGLIPFLCLLLARLLTILWALAGKGIVRLYFVLAQKPRTCFIPSSQAYQKLALASFLALILGLGWLNAASVQDTASSRYPIGGDHHAYQGLEQVVNYFQSIPENTTLYHRWLGGHWHFYLWGNPYDFRAWSSPTDLASQASARAGANQFIVFPSWHSSTPASLALVGQGLALDEVHRAFRDDGTLSFITYRIVEERSTTGQN